ncbi:MAG: hypothetical protein ACI90V_010963, partial [Bacillariaceae sp.]
TYLQVQVGQCWYGFITDRMMSGRSDLRVMNSRCSMFVVRRFVK